MAEEENKSNGMIQPGQVIEPGATPPAKPEALVPDEKKPAMSDATPPSSKQAVSWTASEYIEHHKSAGWYTALTLVALTAASVVYVFTKDVVSTAVIVMGALLLGVYGSRQPRQLQYGLDAGGITIGSKHYAYEEFKSFSIVPEGAFSSIVLMPLKRFAPLTTIYYAPDDEDKIVSIISVRLPFEEHRYDAVDRLMRRIRF